MKNFEEYFKKIEEEGGVPDERVVSTFGLTKAELKTRLKHIAGLCYALACDITNVEIEAEFLREENRYLKARLNKIKARKWTQKPESIEKRRAALLNYWAKKKAETAEEKPEGDE